MVKWGSVLHYKITGKRRVLITIVSTNHPRCNCACCRMDEVVAALGGQNLE